MGKVMARNTRRSNGLKKMEPAVKTLFFTSPSVTSGSTDRFYVDISQCVSLLNRRFYRQGLNWAVAGIKITTAANDGFVYVNKLPETWPMSNAWEKSFRSWRHMIDTALEEDQESIKGRFLDFKVFANANHHNSGVGANLLPVSFDSGIGPAVAVAPAVPGQWQMSSIEVPETTTATGATTEYEIIAVGPNNPGAGASGLNAKSMVAGYANSRALPSPKDPNVPDDASNYTENWMLALTNDGTLQNSAVVDTLEDEGNNPPYPFEGDVAGNLDTMYPGGETQLPGLQIHDLTPITGTTIGNVTRLSGGMFPCGLLEFYCGINSGSSANFVFQIDLVPGNHRGYLAEPMTEM